ncbi:hypothetical protein LJC68_00825 [Bacteroidales bacterium OttesenSCG-928-B11]|nr:hypothetical protein [Bacteroidales bacterium OttesenSCG-928-E04]MDL2308509.1 hypothetical protein [Bacteroidales bacterium OttesenSCG-928-C03]MDL2311407.1 hypothetical protein [Bacteroidales bacterium OttesenSCG-928-B11]MDL2325802.1 hypothetical protein [Bacteroidales bacterium OttesenSCG-928-A14]
MRNYSEMKTINKLVNPQHLTLFEIGKNTIIILMILISVSTASAQRFERYKDSVSVVELSKKEWLYINHRREDTTLLKKKSEPLSKEEYIEDLRYFEEKLVQIDPTIPIKTAMTGYPIMEKIRENNKLFESGLWETDYICKKACQFSNLLLEDLNFCTSTSHLHILRRSDFKNKSLSKSIYYSTIFRSYPSSNKDYLYIDGDYYFAYSNYNKHKRNYWNRVDSVITSRLVENNGDPYPILGITNFKDFDFIQWDYHNQKFYSEYSYKQQLSTNLMMQDASGEKHEMKDVSGGTFNFYELQAIDSEHSIVFYDAECQLLYVKMPILKEINNWMTKHSFDRLQDYLAAISDQISQYKGVGIKKVVFDLRYSAYNPITELLSLVIKEPLYIQNDVYILNNEYVIDLVSKTFENKIDGSRIREECGTSYLLYNSRIDTISPRENSLNYEGNIYFFVNGQASSSDLTVLAQLSQFQRFRIWGVPNGFFLNPGFLWDEYVFEILPKTRYAISINPFITFPPKLENFYDAGIEKRIFMTKEQDVLFRTTKGYIFTYEFLKENDPYFRELLEEL